MEIKNKIIPWGHYKILNFFGILFYKGKDITPVQRNHEAIHTIQMKELFYVGFYLWYLTEYVIVRFHHQKQGKSYHDISFEEEAFHNQSNLDYLTTRKVFDYKWLKYIKIHSWGK